MSVAEEIQEKASQLPPELQAEVLDFIQFLAFKKAKSKESPSRLPNKRGSGKHVITYMADDFDAPLDDLKDYIV